MKNKSKTTVAPTEDEIRDYAFHLYQQSGCVPGHDEENWFEAKACLEANIPKHHARGRLHRHRHPEAERGVIARESSDPQSAEADQDEDVTIEGIVLVSTP
jgi:hypothetical protein